MGTKDFFDLFKINILKNAWLYLSLIVWLIGFIYLVSFIPRFLPLSTLHLLARIQEGIPNRDSWPIPFVLVMVLSWAFTFIVFRELFDRFKNYVKKGNSYSFTRNSWYTGWIYNGKTKVLDGDPLVLQVNSSRAGCLLSKFIWKNFEMKFDVWFMERGIIGIIFRAEDLDNYFMLQLRRKTDSIVIVPHVRYSGMWEVMSQDALGKHNNSKSLAVTLQVKDARITLTIDGVGKYLWNLPTHVDVNHIENGVSNNQNKNSASENEFAAKVTGLPKIQFRDTFGMVGFRAHLDEGANIENLTIKAI